MISILKSYNSNEKQHFTEEKILSLMGKSISENLFDYKSCINQISEVVHAEFHQPHFIFGLMLPWLKANMLSHWAKEAKWKEAKNYVSATVSTLKLTKRKLENMPEDILRNTCNLFQTAK